MCFNETQNETFETIMLMTIDNAIQNFHGIISRSPTMRDVFQIIENVAQTEATVL